MTEIRFTVDGTVAMDKKRGSVWIEPKGNAIPKLKMTGKQHWTIEARRYVKWKYHVVDAYIKALDALSPSAAREAARNYAVFGKPIVLPPTMRARMDIVIEWYDGHHGDPENIFGSIADALFKDDKRLAGDFDFEDSTGDGKVDILITISEQRTWRQKPKTEKQIP